MIPDDPELRRAFDDRSATLSDEYRARLRRALTSGPRTSGSSGWMAATAVAVVILLTATSVGVVVAYRQAHRGVTASGPRVTSPTPGVGSPNVYLSAPAPDVVWALVDHTRLYRSTDRGERWEARSLPESSGVKPTISFVDDHEGWLLAPGSPTTQCGEATAVLWHTTDGARSWHQVQTSGLGAAQCKEVVYFSPDGRHGFITAWDDNHKPAVYWSVDGGQGWKKATLDDPPDFVSAPGGFNLRVQWVKAVGNTFYLEAYGSQGPGSPYPEIPNRQYIFLSTNGGGTWVWKQKVASRELVIVTPSRWLEIDPPRLYESVNGGQGAGLFESNLVVDPKAAPGQIIFAGESVGYVSRGSTLQRSVDGGTHWIGLGLPGSPPVTAAPSPSASPSYFMPAPVQLDAPTSDVVWAYIPFDKVLFVSSDRGDHWEVRNLPPDAGNTFPNATFLDAQEGWFLGGAQGSGDCATERVKLWHTTDGAETWEPVDTSGISDAQCKLNLVFADRTHAYMVSEESNLLPRIYRSTDGGHTWSWTTLPDPIDFQSVPDGYAYSAGRVKRFGTTELVDAFGNGYLSTKAGSFVYRSDDGGAHWTLAATLGDVPGGVVFLSPSRWLMLQGPVGSRETVDGGKTWRSFSSDYDDAAPVASDFVFADSQVGYGTVRGSFHRTVDGGAHWTMPATPWTPAA